MSQSMINSRVDSGPRTAPTADCGAGLRVRRGADRAAPGRRSTPRTPSVGRGRTRAPASARRGAGSGRSEPRWAPRPRLFPGRSAPGGGPGRRRRGAAPARSTSRTSSDALIRRPCSSHVYHVTDTPARSATSSRRSPGVRRPRPGGSPTCSGRIDSRRARRKSASSRRWSPELMALSQPDPRAQPSVGARVSVPTVAIDVSAGRAARGSESQAG